MILDPDHFIDGYVSEFNANEPSGEIVQDIPNAQAAAWMRANAPMFACPDEQIARVFAFRWWVFRKHFKSTPHGRIVTEFLMPVRHAGTYNSISCALGHHMAEGRWLADQRPLDEYARFWFVADDGKPEYRFHRYSSWFAHALWERACATGNFAGVIELLDLLVTDYQQWEAEKRLADGSFFQFDVWDGMEESISGSRTARHIRPTINSYMYANAEAIAKIANLAGRTDLTAPFVLRAAELKTFVQQQLWDAEAKFFKVRLENGSHSDAREAIGFVPWAFDLPDGGFEAAWAQLTYEHGFWAPAGLTTAERRHPKFRSHGVGKCEWDGAVWPFATSQTLVGLARALRRYPNMPIGREAYLQAIRIFAASHTRDGLDYIGEYHDEITGRWLKGHDPRGTHYNHSTYCDLIISGLVGVLTREDATLSVEPLLPAGAWSWFCLDELPYRGRRVCIIWDADGTRFGRGRGMSIFVDGQLRSQRVDLGRVDVELEV